ncbi:MAG: 50S ribosomal protein L18 [Candidatus Colwellbacteria bacterium]|nr:50S ribosomal protein L18 [Candidatus Colwellbacteria bacterium]
MNKIKALNKNKERRAKRTRAKLFGTNERPRLSIYRSNRYIVAQAIDDENGKTVFAGSTREIKEKGTKTEKSVSLGNLMAEKAKKAGIEKMVFDRGSYRYHGRVKAVAESLRNSGIKI